MEMGGIELTRLLGGRDHSPVVYFLRLGDWVKIGTTTNLVYRANALSVTISEVAKIVPGGVEVEAEMHRTFARYRIYADREWFRRSGALKRYLMVGAASWYDSRPEPSAEPQTPRLAVRERPQRPEFGITLAEAVTRGTVTMSLAALRKSSTRDPMFPRAVGTYVSANLYDPDALSAWQLARARSAV